MSSTLSAAQTAIYDRLNTAWAGSTLIQWPGSPFTTPNNECWIGVEILWGDSFVSTMEVTGRNVTVGVIQINVYGPRQRGRAEIMAKADAVRDVFNRVEFNGVRCGAPSGPKYLSDPEWEALTVSVPFSIEEVT